MTILFVGKSVIGIANLTVRVYLSVSVCVFFLYFFPLFFFLSLFWRKKRVLGSCKCGYSLWRKKRRTNCETEYVCFSNLAQTLNHFQSSSLSSFLSCGRQTHKPTTMMMRMLLLFLLKCIV